METERSILVPVETVDGFHDGDLRIFAALEIVVVNRGSFEVIPESLNQIQVRRTGGVPNDGETMSMFGDERIDRSRVVDRAVVQEQVQVIVVGADVLQQPPKERRELSASFTLSDQRTTSPVIASSAPNTGTRRFRPVLSSSRVVNSE